MGRFRELEEFERQFEEMDIGQLKLWKWYWTRHAQQLGVKARKQAMKRVYDIEKAIIQKGGDASGPAVITAADPSPADSLGPLPTQKATARAGRIMYIERKAGSLTGPARIGRVTYSKSGRTLYYGGHRFQSLKGAGFKSNYYDVDTGEDYWISGPKRNGGDALYGGRAPIQIDEDVREEYWTEIRRELGRLHERVV